MSRENQPLFIWLLEYGEKTNNRRISINELINAAVEEGLCCSHTDSSAQVLRSLFFECFDIPDSHRQESRHSGYALISDSDHVSANLKSEYYFRLLEFRELQLARETAEQANRSSIIAQQQSRQSIRIAIYAVLASVFIAISTTAWQLSSSVQIDPQQLSRLEAVLINHLESLPVATSATDTEENDNAHVLEPASQLVDPSASLDAGKDLVDQ